MNGPQRTLGLRPRFDGATFDPGLDQSRLSTQLGSVFRVMRGGDWATLSEIAQATDCPEASISARIRDLRKPRFGAYTIERRRCVTSGTWQYRLTGGPQ